MTEEKGFTAEDLPSGDMPTGSLLSQTGSLPSQNIASRDLGLKNSTAEPAGLPIGLGDNGDPVADIRRRLYLAGCEVGDSQVQHFTQLTEEAVFLFQAAEGLPETGQVDRATWSALIEASRSLGDRPLYLRQPMLRGQDVVDLQHLLGKLGFDAGRADGFFGPQTANALLMFQQNTALNDDSICGPSTVAMLNRVTTHSGEESVASLREREQLRSLPPTLNERKIAIGETGGLGALTEAIHRSLRKHKAQSLVLRHPNTVIQAEQANKLEAELYLGFELQERPACTATYFATDKFISQGGKRFAELVTASLAGVLGTQESKALGMRLQILQKTRMPALWLYIGPPSVVVQRTAEIADLVTKSIHEWVTQPV